MDDLRAVQTALALAEIVGEIFPDFAAACCAAGAAKVHVETGEDMNSIGDRVEKLILADKYEQAMQTDFWNLIEKYGLLVYQDAKIN